MDNESNENPNPTTQRNLTNIILRESERMANTVTDFLHYALPADPKFTKFNLKEIADDAVALLTSERRECSEKVIEINIPENFEIIGDRELVQIALSHLLRNSCHAVRESAAPIICSAGRDQDHNPAWYYIEVEDKGCGIDPAIQDKLFDPFFTTREDTAGLGLAIVKQIVTSHNGIVEMESQLQQGCRTIIRLPATQDTTL
jgi:two-component system sensor histidine kinase PilS (NtrC family)